MSKLFTLQKTARNHFAFGPFQATSIALLALAIMPLAAAVAVSPDLTIRLQYQAYDGSEARDAVATTVAVSADGQLIAAGSDDHRLRVWDAQSGEPIEQLTAHHQDWIRGVQFSAGGDQIASVGADRRLHLFSLNALSDSQATQLMPETDGALLAVAFHPTKPLLATAGFDNPIRIYDLSTGKQVQELVSPSEDVRTVQFSQDGRWLAAAGRDGVVRVWDQLSESSSQDLPSDGRRVRTLAFSPDSQIVAAAGDGPAVRVWRYDSERTTLQSGATKGSFNPIAEEILTRPGKNYSMVFLTDVGDAVAVPVT